MPIPTSGFKTALGSSCLGLFSHIKQLYTVEEHKLATKDMAILRQYCNPFSTALQKTNKRINQYQEPPAKMSRGVKKLTSKSTSMH